MGTTDAGCVIVAQLIAGQIGVNPYNATHAYLGVGDSNTVFAASQTDLQASSGATHRQFNPMYSGFPATVTDNTITFQAQFGLTEANFHWQENGVFNASSSGTMLVRTVEDLGTKTSSAVWVLSKTLTIEG